MNIARLHANGHTQVFVARVSGAIHAHAVATIADPSTPEKIRKVAIRHVGFSTGVGECASYCSAQGLGPFSTDGDLRRGVASYFGWATGGIDSNDEGCWESS